MLQRRKAGRCRREARQRGLEQPAYDRDVRAHCGRGAAPEVALLEAGAPSLRQTIK